MQQPNERSDIIYIDNLQGCPLSPCLLVPCKLALAMSDVWIIFCCMFPGYLSTADFPSISSYAFFPSPGYLPLECLLIAACAFASFLATTCPTQAGLLLRMFRPFPGFLSLSCVFARFSWVLAACRLAYRCVVPYRLANRFLCFAPSMTSCSM